MKQKGFTLLELSIVIVIIGLIVAGISAGQSLVRQASLRSVVSDLSNFETAYNSFKLQYDAVPGDMSNAFDYWGSACGGNDQASCDGDGDGVVEISATANLREDTAAWEHMTLAGVIDGTYTYVSGNTILGQNVIPGPITSTGYWLWGSSGLRKNFVSLGSDRSDAGGYFSGEALRPSEAFAIDSKNDDGRPGTGRNITNRDQDRWNTAGICVDLDNAVSDFTIANYILDDTTVSCYIRYDFN